MKGEQRCVQFVSAHVLRKPIIWYIDVTAVVKSYLLCASVRGNVQGLQLIRVYFSNISNNRCTCLVAHCNLEMSISGCQEEPCISEM